MTDQAQLGDNGGPRYIIGGAGYIGAHVGSALQQQGAPIVVIDDFSTGLPRRTEALHAQGGCSVETCDVLEVERLTAIFEAHGPGPVYHFAALKDAAASVAEAETYVTRNTALLLSCLDAMQAAGLNRLIYSSTAAVYGEPHTLPIQTAHPLAPASPYGASKLVCEAILQSAMVRQRVASVLLRYFNPVGCGAALELGYDYHSAGSVPIFPAIARSIIDPSQRLTIHRSPQPTRDGTTVRDFIHVADLARAHIAAEALFESQGGVTTLNLGTGSGVTINEVLNTFEAMLNAPPSYEMVPPREGDISQSFCDFEEARRALGWQPEKTVLEMCDSELCAARHLVCR